MSGFTDTVAICARAFVVWRFPFAAAAAASAALVAPSASDEDYGFFLCHIYIRIGVWVA